MMAIMPAPRAATLPAKVSACPRMRFLAAMAAGVALATLVGHHPARAQASADAGVTVAGRVVDSESKQPVPQAEVVIVDTGLHTFTGEDGRFKFASVPPGAHAVAVSCLGYKPLRTDLPVGSSGVAGLELTLVRSAIPLQEVTVTPGAFSLRGTVPNTRQTMTREDIEAMPQIADDVFRAVNRLPGLSSNDYSAHFGIRGGRHDETLILLDGLELYEPYHLKDFNEGAISIIDNETIDGVQLMTGGFPSRYGNKRSGVFDITSRTPEDEGTHASVALSTMTARLMARGRIAGDKGSWLAFARGGSMNIVFNLIDQGDLPVPQYEDAFGKMSLRLNSKHVLGFEVLQAGDRYEYDIPATTGFQDSLNTREKAANTYGNTYGWLTLHSTLGASTVVRTMASVALVSRDRNGYERFANTGNPIYAITGNRNYDTYGFQQDWTQSLGANDVVNLGFDVRQQHMDDSFHSIAYQDPDDPSAPDTSVFPVRTNREITQKGTRFSGYLSDRWRVVTPLVLELGVRYDQASYTSDQDWSPRVSAALGLGGGRTLRAGWGYYRQIQGIDEVTALDTQSAYFSSELSKQTTVGLEQQIGEATLVRLEGYYKDGSNLRPVYRNWKGAIDAFPEPNEDRILVYPKTSKSEGVEFYLDQKFSDRFAVRASYALSKATETVSGIVNVNSTDSLYYDLEHPSPQDQRHAANADFTYRFWGQWSLNGAFAWHTGWPATHEKQVSVINGDGNPDYAVHPVKLYAERLPDYLRLDARVTRRWPMAGGDLRAFFEVINLTNHANVFGYDYFLRRDDTGQIVLDRGDETWFTILPSIGFVWNKNF